MAFSSLLITVVPTPPVDDPEPVVSSAGALAEGHVDARRLSASTGARLGFGTISTPRRSRPAAPSQLTICRSRIPSQGEAEFALAPVCPALREGIMISCAERVSGTGDAARKVLHSRYLLK